MSLGAVETFGIALMATWGTAGAVALGRSMEIRPSDITNATLTADFDGTILSRIDETAVTFSNGVTRAIVGTNAVPFAPFSLASDITNVVSHSTNEVWHWYASSVNNHPLEPTLWPNTFPRLWTFPRRKNSIQTLGRMFQG